MSKSPPVPPEQRGLHTPQSESHPDLGAHGGGRPDRRGADPDHRGDQANIRQNTSHAGNVQDR